MIVDANAYLGPYPFRRLPVTEAEGLLALMDRAGIDRAAVASVPSVFYRNAAAGNGDLLAQTAPHGKRLLPLVTLDPTYPGWEADLQGAIGNPRVAGVRVYPNHHGIPVEGEPMKALALRLAEESLPLFLAVQFEDWRQRHRLDTVPNLLGETVRFLIRETESLKVVVTNADVPLIQEIFYGLTEAQKGRVWFDNAFLWGPPAQELQKLVNAIGASRFVFGTHMPFRIPEAGLKKIEALEVDPAQREGILGSTLLEILRSP
ncbi:MAG: amidohydrolase family protein [Planctomycetota bacterium]|jgi:predicted TIM-barrel fold metal-dependent hydrolase